MRDENGRAVYYPWGVFGKGRILPDEASQRRLRGLVQQSRRGCWLFPAPNQHFRGFKRNADGVFEPPIDDPNGLSAINYQTYVTGINDSGVIVGYYVNPKN